MLLRLHKRKGNIRLKGPVTGKEYVFVRAGHNSSSAATEVDDEDVPKMLEMTFTSGCCNNKKSLKMFEVS